MHRSAALGDLESVQKCIEAGISPLQYNDILEVSCASGNSDLVQTLINNNVRVNNIDNEYYWGSTLNHAKNKETIEILIQHGADVNHKSNPLIYISESGNIEAVNYMIECGAKLVMNEQNALWFGACKGGILFLVKELYSKVDPESTYYEGKGITVAAAHNRLEVVKWLFEKGVNVYPETLIGASKNGNVKTVEWLLKNTSLEINTITEFGHTALSEAIQYRQFETVNYLLDQGADHLQQYGDYGFSAIHTACFSRSIPIIERLLVAGASIDCIATDKRTPLFIAADTNNQELVNFLLEKGAVVPNWKIEYYLTIQEVARRNKISITKPKRH
jgi:ankyrin repeat protein